MGVTTQFISNTAASHCESLRDTILAGNKEGNCVHYNYCLGTVAAAAAASCHVDNESAPT